MSSLLSAGDSAQPGNAYTFHCPIVNRTARYVVCAFLRHKEWRGEGFQAHDCKCAMRAGKCPAVRMLQYEWRTGKREFFDTQPTLHKLPALIMDQIERIMVRPLHATGLNVSPEQMARLTAGELTQADGTHHEAGALPEPSRRRRARGASPQSAMVEGLAEAQSDTAAVINKAIEVASGDD